MHAVRAVSPTAGDIDNIQASWVNLGLGGLAQLLPAGVNDAGVHADGSRTSRAPRAPRTGSRSTSTRCSASRLGSRRTLRQRTTPYGAPEHELAAAA